MICGGLVLLTGIFLIASYRMPPLVRGVQFTGGVSLLGMALGRMMSLAIEPAETNIVVVFMLVELLGATLLFAAGMMLPRSR